VNASGFESLADHGQSCASWFGFAGLELADGHDPYFRGLCEVVLGPVDKAASGSALRRCNHAYAYPKTIEKRQ
jgi:hypothetical protein